MSWCGENLYKDELTEESRKIKTTIMSIYFRSSLGIAFPKSPYIGQIYYDPDLKRTFRYEEKDFGDCILKSTIDWFHWVDITEKDII